MLGDTPGDTGMWGETTVVADEGPRPRSFFYSS